MYVKTEKQSERRDEKAALIREKEEANAENPEKQDFNRTHNVRKQALGPNTRR